MSYEYEFKEYIRDEILSNINHMNILDDALDELDHVYTQAAKADEYEAKAEAFDAILKSFDEALSSGHMADDVCNICLNIEVRQMAKEKFRISKVSSKVESDDFWYEPDYWTVGYYVTLNNVNNPFDYFTQYVPKEDYSEEEFAVGRIVELEVDDDD